MSAFVTTQSARPSWPAPRSRFSGLWVRWCPQALDRSPALVDWILALYLFLMFGLQATQYWYWSTYVAYGVFLCWLPTLLFFRRYWLTPELTLSIGLMLLTTVSSYLAPYNCWPAAWYTLKILLMSWIIMLRCDSFAKLRLFLTAAFLGAMVVAIPGILLGSAAVSEGSTRQVGITTEPNAYGFILTAGVYASFVLLVMGARWLKWPIIISWAVFLVDIAGSGSRQAIVNVAALVLAYIALEWVLHLRSNVRNLILGGMLLILLALILFSLKSESLLQRFEGRDVTQDPRIEIIKIGWELFLKHPYFGIGPGAFIIYTRWVYTHTAFMELLATTGIFSFFCYYGMLGWLWIRLMRLRRRYAEIPEMRRLFSALLAVLASTLVAGLFNLTHISKMNTFFVGATVGVSAHLMYALRAYASAQRQAWSRQTGAMT